MKGFMVPAAAFAIAMGLVYGGGRLLKRANVPAPYTLAGFATSAIWAGAYRSILGEEDNIMTTTRKAPTIHKVEPEHLVTEPGQPIENHLRRLNNIFCEYWKHTHFYLDMNYEVPIVQIEGYDGGDNLVNNDGEIHFFYHSREGQVVPDNGCSYGYWIRPDGTVYCNTNEVMDLKSINHLFGVIITCIKDIYGDFDAQKAYQNYMDGVLKTVEVE